MFKAVSNMFGGTDEKKVPDGSPGQGIEGDIEMEKQKLNEARTGNTLPDSNEVGQMKRSDYMIHVFIEKIKEIKCPPEATLDPMIEVECFKIKKYTSAKQGIGGIAEVTYNEHLFIEKSNVEAKEAKEAKIDIRLYDKGFFKNVVLGSFYFDLSQIYFMKDHLLLHKWLALSNPTSEDYADITGYLKLSISVIAAGDEQIKITADESLEDDQAILMPPQLNPKFYQLKIRIFQAQGLTLTDMAIQFLQEQAIDAYVMTTYKNRKLKTDTKTMNKQQDDPHSNKIPTIEWNQEIFLPCQIPSVSNTLILRLMDTDPTGDEIVGSIVLDMKEIVGKGIKGQPRWKNVYGAPELNQGLFSYMIENKSIKKEMNENPELASNWKGRILMQVECDETVEPEKPVAYVQPIETHDESIDDETTENIKQLKKLKDYTIICEVGQALALPESKKYSIKFIIGGIVLQTKESQTSESNHQCFNERIKTDDHNGGKTEIWNVKLPYGSVNEFGKIFVFLMDGDLPVSYLLDDATNYTDIEKSEFQWKQFKPDPYVGVVDSTNHAGMVSYKLCIHDVAAKKKQINNLKDYPSWEVSPNKRLETVKIRAYIYQCRDLPAADSNGTSDAYAKVWNMAGEEKKTRVIEDSNNPVFFETVELEYEVRSMTDRKCYPPFIIDVFDSDTEFLDQTDDFLARAVINPEQLEEALEIQKDYEDMTCDCEQKNQFQKCPTCKHTWEIPGKRALPEDQKEKTEHPDHYHKRGPKWFPLHFEYDEPQCGEILVSFAVSDQDYAWKNEIKQLDLKSESDIDFDVVGFELHLLGLRGLQSPGILPVEKAFIQFNIRSLVSPYLQDLQNIRTQPSASGPNPTLNTTLNFSLRLPVDELYCPRLSCSVYDNILMGLNQPMIGAFTVDIWTLLTEQYLEKLTQLKSIKDVNDKLLGMFKGEIDYPEDQKIQKEQVDNQQQNRIDAEGKASQGAAPTENKLQQIKQIYQDSLQASTTDHLKLPGDDTAPQASGNIKARKRRPADGSQQNRITNQGLKKAITKMNIGLSVPEDGLDVLGPDEDEENRNAIEQKEQEINYSLQQSIEKDYQTSDASKRQNKWLVFNSDSDQNQESSSAKTSSVGKKVYDILKQKKDLFLQNQELFEKEMNIQEEERLRSGEELNRKGDDGWKMVRMPEYYNDSKLKIDKEKQEKMPPKNLFLELGWDEDSNTRRKHYRHFYNDELENVNEIFPHGSPFSTFPIMRGQSRGLSQGGFLSFFRAKRKQDASGQDSTVKCVGTFKGIGQIQQNKKNPQLYEKRKNEGEKLVDLVKQIAQKNGANIQITSDVLTNAMECRKLDVQLRKLKLGSLEITKNLRALYKDELLLKRLLAVNKTTIRVYMIDAFDLASRDWYSSSDPYLYLQCNDKTVNERDNYQPDEPNPKFYKSFDFLGTFPGCSPLRIDVYDYDDIFGDELIGTSMLDLEDRYFSAEWQALIHKPVESRQLYHDSSQISQGVVRCWVELNSFVDPKKSVDVWNLEEKKYQKQYVDKWDITPKPTETFEVRICVLNAEEIPMEDIEGTSDVYFRGFFDTAEDVQETDVHYRNQDGNPDFQYRLIYRVKIPNKDYKFTLQCYDKDWIKSTDLIGETQIDIKTILYDCAQLKKPIKLDKDYYETQLKPHDYQVLEFDKADKVHGKQQFWLNLKVKNEENKNEVRGKVKLQLDVLPLAKAETNPVGKAREDPNHSPYLPMPKGRLDGGLINPFYWWSKMVDPAIKKYICILICVILLCILILIMGPTLASLVIYQQIKAVHGDVDNEHSSGNGNDADCGGDMTDGNGNIIPGQDIQ